MESLDDILKRIKTDFNEQDGTETTPETELDSPYIGDPDCPICHGIGYISYDYPVGHPQFGKMQVCPCRQQKVENAKKRETLIESNISGYENMTFENFNVEGLGHLRQDQIFSLRLAKSHAQKFAEEPIGWLLFNGPYGTGKTHLAAAIANQAMRQGIPLLFQPTPDLLDWLRSSYGGGGSSYQERFDHIRSVQLLILDDLGTQNATPWAEEKLYQILNYRYINHLPTVITTNNNLRDIDGRIASRLEDPNLVTQIVIRAPDYRSPLANPSSTDDLSILHLLPAKTFESFNFRKNENLSQEGSAQLMAAIRAAKAFAQEPRGWLVFAGASGIGKTHLAAAIGNYRKSQLDDPLMISAADLLDHLRAAYSPTSTKPYDERFEKVRSSKLLILNYLDTMNTTPWAREKMIQLLNYRYHAQLPTVITLNIPIQNVDPNIRSRLVDASVCTVIQMFDVPMYSKNSEIDVTDTLPRIKGSSASGKQKYSGRIQPRD